MLDLTDVLNVNSAASLNFAALFTNKAYNEPNEPTEAANDGDVIDDIEADIASSTIENSLRAAVARRRQATTNASEAISMLQTFQAATSTINGKLTQMASLANESAGSSRTYTDEEKAAMQTQFEALAGEINDIVNNTQSSGNKLLSATGQTVSVSIGNGSIIQISPRNLSIDVDGLDMSIAPGGPGMAIVETATEQTSDYQKYLNDVTKELEKVAEIFEFDFVGSLGTEPSVGDSILAVKEAAEVVSQLIANNATLIKIQAEVTSDTALQLLKSKSYSDDSVDSMRRDVNGRFFYTNSFLASSATQDAVDSL
jgi:flagellin